MLRYKRLISIASMIILVDLILITSFIWYNKPTPDVSIGELMMIPIIIVVHLIVAMIISFFARGETMKLLAKLIISNAFVASLIFHGLWALWYSYYESHNFLRYDFEQNGKQIEIMLNKPDISYSFSDVSDPGSTTEFKRGLYIIN